ncbi:MAG TPA: hypothetical protein VGR57_01370 [Ktedonobacterales bacterium]|nr:hypothetical protein [Ktedonobacterales bacterium]
MDEPDPFSSTPEFESEEETGVDDEPAQANEALRRAAAAWARRGYRPRYEDDFLVQLVKQTEPRWPLVAALIALALLALPLVLRRRWVVVSLTSAPDGRIITVRQAITHPPED